MQNQDSKHLGHVLNKRNLNIMTIALLALLVVAAYTYDFYVFTMAVVAMFVSILVEYAFAHFRKKPFEPLGILVTPLIFTLMMPSNLPLYMVGVGAFFSVFFGKMIFGGLGRNIFNPAIVGYLFVIITFPVETTGNFLNPGTDVLSGPTVLRLRELSLDQVEGLLFGSYAGTLGDTVRIAVLVLGLLLVVLKISDWRLPLSVLAGTVLFTFIFDTIYPENFHNPLLSIFVGGAMFTAFFIATDPVSAPFTNWGKIIYGLGIAFISVIIRGLAAFPEGFIFGVIIMNAIAPMIDGIKWIQPKKEVTV
jgi:Na+-translocating ferredoxin:NAD+ oxidoreductase RnfD subunit